ncbi:hypothetical protein CEP52_006394 [Fusarium oligoseptatum]|uniref:Uncharacterized protein n=1 Tax=Fusarium oligoseptatum TaxID=2604345 RepID=A0A428TT24_9HYPO|nr:hypothetical protein CEP52_006394 [Fusarium oligoseptatum]
MGLYLPNPYGVRAFIVSDESATKDIKEANMFYRRLRRYPGKEEELKRSIIDAIYKTENALQEFREVFGFVEPTPQGNHHETEKEKEEALKVFRESMKPKGIRRKLKWILSDRKEAKKLSLMLEYARLDLSHRVIWMQTALDRLDNSPSSMPIKSASTKLPSSVPPDQRD